MGNIQIEVTERELGYLEEAVSHLMPTKRGPKLREMIALRTKLLEEIAANRGGDMADD